jgi:hypothetical protein
MAMFIEISLNKGLVAYIQLLPEDAEKIADIQIKFAFYSIALYAIIHIGIFICDFYDE